MKFFLLFLFCFSVHAGWYPPVGLQGGALGKMTGALTMQSQTEIRFADADSTNYIAIKSSGTIATNFTWTLPNAYCVNGQALVFSDSAGKMTCGNVAATLNYDWTSYTPTFTGFGTATSISFYHKRVGSDLLIRGKFTAGTTTGTEARISLPSGLTAASTIATIESVGSYFNSNSGGTVFKGGSVLIEPSVTYLTIGSAGTFNNNSLDALGKATGSGSNIVSGEKLSFIVRVPIEEWAGSL